VNITHLTEQVEHLADIRDELYNSLNDILIPDINKEQKKQDQKNDETHNDSNVSLKLRYIQNEIYSINNSLLELLRRIDI